MMDMPLRQPAYAVNCAHPGDTLTHMVDARRDPKFIALLSGRQAQRWDGILLSAGGNDLIDAIGVLPRAADGTLISADKRILLKPSEWKNGTQVSRYVSDAGWQLFEAHLVAQYHEMIALRDAPRSLSKGVPMFVHCYDYPMPRNAKAGPAGPWLYPAVVAYQIPQDDWLELATHLIGRLKDLITNLALPNLIAVDTTATLIPAQFGSTGSSGDWENEIHPTPQGYEKLKAKYAAAINQVFT